VAQDPGFLFEGVYTRAAEMVVLRNSAVAGSMSGPLLE
jgi:hypothetical protein